MEYGMLEQAIADHQEDFAKVYSMIAEAQSRAWQQVNKTLIQLYWNIGQYVSEKVESQRWGKGIVEKMAQYIASKSPSVTGFSARNIWRMKQFFETYREHEKLSALLTELPNTLGQFKDSYIFEFLSLPDDHKETDLRRALVLNLKKFLTELGPDFSLIGEEYPLQVGMKDFRIDLLMFHRGLNCMVAIELKTTEFHPGHMGQLQFYLEALDQDIKKPHENPSIGILICKTKDEKVVKYAMNRSMSPTMIAEYETKLIDKLLLQKKLNEFYDAELESIT
jgi:predicted nuclease of restriction endonuclease-like (RecB) superfamily